MKVTEYTLLTPATSPALDLELVKEHLKISDSDSDAKLLMLIGVVSDYAEKATGRDLITKTYKGYLDFFPLCSDIEIRKSKLKTITSIQYYLNGVLTTWASTDYYFIDSENYSSINLVNGKSYPDNVDERRQAVVITFTAGYGTKECDIPVVLQQAMLSHLTALYENAGDCADSNQNQFKYLYAPFIISSNLFRVV